MRPSFRQLAIGVLVLASTGCTRGCTCIEGEKTYEHLDGKVKVELVRSTRWTGGKIPGPLSSFSIRVHTAPPFDEPVQCEKVELAEDDAGTNVAFRCKDAQTWEVIRLRGTDRHLRECNAHAVGTGKKPDFSALTKISVAAPSILDCAEAKGEYFTPYGVFTELARSIKEDEGGDAAIALVSTIASRPFGAAANPDPWRHALDAIAPDEKAKVLAQVCPALVDANALPPRYLRAARGCPLDDAKIGDVARARFQRELSGYAGKPDAALDDAVRWAAVLASRADAAKTGEAACAVLHDLVKAPRELAILAIARGKVKCALGAALSPPPCGGDLECDGGLCSARDLAPDVDAWVTDPIAGDGGVRIGSPPEPRPHRALVAAAYAQGPLDREIALRNARRHYSMASDAGAPCWGRAARDAPCSCDLPPLDRICDMPADAGRYTYLRCNMRIDDEHHRFDDTRHTCDGEGERCGGDGCCAPLECVMHDGGTRCTRDGG